MISRSCAAIALLVFQLAGGPAVAQQYVISTYAGGAPPPTPIAALTASIGLPQGVTTDAAGNVYFSSNLHCVFKLDLNGILTRVAGNSRPGYSGDGGPAIDAQLYIPSLEDEEGSVPGGLAMDSLGNLYIADFGNNRVRRVSADGIITTVAGNGAWGYSGDSGPAVDAQLSSPQGVALDIAGNLYITDTGNNLIRKVSLAGIITTVAGNFRPCCYEPMGDGGPATSARLGGPSGLAIDSADNLFVTSFGGTVRKISPDGIITTVAGSTFGYSGDGGPAANAQFSALMGLAVDSTGNLYILDAGNSRVRKVSPDGIITTVAGNGSSGYSGDGKPATSAQITGARSTIGLAVDTRGGIYLGDGYRIRKVSSDGIITTAAGNGSFYDDYPGEGVPATSARLSYPGVLAVDRAGNLYIADPANSRVRKVSPNGVIRTVAGNGVRGSLGDGGPATSAQLSYPYALAVDSAGNLYIAGGDYRVRKVSPNGVIRTVAGNGVRGSLGDGGPATSAQLAPISLAADSAGNLYIANEDYSNYGPPRFEPDYRVRKVSPAGIITTVAGNGMGGYSGDGGPATSAHLHIGGSSLAVDSAGSLYFQELGRIRRVSPAGMITTIAGNGTYGYSGDGGPATQIGSPVGVAVDGEGNLYVADPWNAVVRILRPANRSVLIGAVVDAASQRADPVSPGKIVVIYGAGLGPSQLSAEPAGTAVSFNGLDATILYTSATQVAVVAPNGVTSTSAQVTVTYQGEVSDAFTVRVAASAPSLFTLNQAGWGQAAAIHADGTPNTAANPVRIGGFVSLYATGEGQTGRTTPPMAVVPVSVTVGGIPATVQYAGGAPGRVAGLMQVTVQILNGVQPGGYVPVVLQVGDRTSSPAVWIAVSGN